MKPLRKCRSCGLEASTESDLNLFRVNTKSKYGKDNHCKACHQKEGRQYWKEANGRNKKLQQKYGITVDDYNKMFTEQKGCCAICGKHQIEDTTSKSFLCVDHNHITGEVRALLCDSCNMGLGKFYDNKETLQKALEYLERFE